MKAAVHVLKRLGRALVIVLLVMAGSTVLVRLAPGYLSDARELDSRYADAARAELSAEAAHSKSLGHMLYMEIAGWTRGDLGVSRQFEVPVQELILPRLAVSGGLMLRAIFLAWMLALGTALISSAARTPSLLWQLPAALLLAVPTAAMATICLLTDSGGPLLVMTLLLAARDFKFVDRILRKTWRDPHLLQARAQGVRPLRLLLAHLIPAIVPQLLALATLSIVTALSAVVPVEVIFNMPGVGQLAWNAAMNRDLPVLLAVTGIMALAVTIVGMASDRPAEWKNA